ncbi:MAG: aromatic ring-hydroxylating dioxygenase subunit alpha, partial [Candidatus Binatia bacterium]
TRQPVPTLNGHMWVPIDDDNTMVYNWMLAADEDRPLTRELILSTEKRLGRGPDGETTVRRRTRANDWLIDRGVQRTKTFTGIAGTNTQDLAVQESMGPIVDRSREHLGSTDKAIIVFRRILLDLVSGLQRGNDPLGTDPTVYRGVRPADLVMPKDVAWQEGAKDKLTARW